MSNSLTSQDRTTRTGFSLIELVVVVAIIAILMGILIPSIVVARTRAKQTQVVQAMTSLSSAFSSYRQEDPQGRYPAERVDAGLHRDLIELLDSRRLWLRGNLQYDENGLLVDPWRQPIRYSLTRPTPAAGADVLSRWNWDDEQDRPALWGRALARNADGSVSRDASGRAQQVEGPLPFPYIWSIGKAGSDDDASTWLIAGDGQ